MTTSRPYASNAHLRAALVDAARELTVTHGWDRVRMLDVAKIAGVSRQTVYNEFGGRDGLAEELATSEIQRFVSAVREEMFTHGGEVRAAALATILRVLDEAAANPIVHGILTSSRGGADELLPYLTTRADVVLRAAGQVVTEWISAFRPQTSDETAALAAESIIRLTVSHIMLPTATSHATADALAEVFTRLLS